MRRQTGPPRGMFFLFGGLLVLGSGCGVKDFHDLKKEHDALQKEQERIVQENRLLQEQFVAIKSAQFSARSWKIYPYVEKSDFPLSNEFYIESVRFRRVQGKIVATVDLDPAHAVRPDFKIYLFDRHGKVCCEMAESWAVYKISKKRKTAQPSGDLDQESQPLFFSVRFVGL